MANKRYLVHLQGITRFSFPVTQHAFLLRTAPFLGDGRQEVERRDVFVFPDVHIVSDTDVWGNVTEHGFLLEGHDRFNYVSSSVVVVRSEGIAGHTQPSPWFRSPTSLTAVTPEMAAAFHLGRPFAHPLDRAEELSCLVHDTLAYTPMSTNVDTPAAVAFRGGTGVCQDFAHILLGLCRKEGIAARYVCGMLEGEGATHAWVEVHDGFGWVALDPTAGKRATEGYVKLAHGRDAADCPVVRGLYFGRAWEESEVHCLVEPI